MSLVARIDSALAYELNTSSLNTALLIISTHRTTPIKGTYLSGGTFGILRISMRFGDLAIISGVGEN